MICITIDVFIKEKIENLSHLYYKVYSVIKNTDNGNSCNFRNVKTKAMNSIRNRKFFCQSHLQETIPKKPILSLSL